VEVGLGKQVGGDVFIVFVIITKAAVQEADTARLHHADEQFLFRIAVALPN
jgi:hypothetical protein